MQDSQKQIFIQNFFDFLYPQPFESRFSQEELKNNNMKISLQIACRSYLRMQSDPKTNLVCFSCKNYGKDCFEIFSSKSKGFYVIETDYSRTQHKKKCELHGESFEYLKIYNLMKLKKNLIESTMKNNNLLSASPSQILSQISSQNGYFFQKRINYNPEMRRKLRKRFDNIINIDIKKITKGGRDDLNQNYYSKILKQKKNLSVSNNNLSEFSQLDIDKAYVQNLKKQTKKNKTIKKKHKQNFNQKKKISLRNQNKENFEAVIQEKISKPPVFKIQDQIYMNPASQSELIEIKELNQQIHCFQNIFSWQFLDPCSPSFPETINEKQRQNAYRSLRNNIIKHSIETQSLSNFPENIGELNILNQGDQVA